MNRKISPEFGAIPIVLVLLGAGLLIIVFGTSASKAWLLAAVPILAVGLLLGWALFSRRRPPADAPYVAGSAAARAVADEGISRVLVIADESCASAGLGDELAGRTAGRQTEAFVIAPALASRLARWTGDEKAYEEAERLLEVALTDLRGAGISARGHIGAHDPIQAADDGLREFRATEIVFVTHDETDANWLEQGVVDKARDRYGLPVSQIVVERTR